MAVKNNQGKYKGNVQSPNSFIFNKWVQIIIVCFTVILLYGKTVNNQFIGLDDTSLIVDNYPFIRDWKNIPQAFKQDVFKIHKDLDNTKDYYRPVITLSFMLDAHIAPPATKDKPVKPKVYLVSNIIYHSIACLLLLLLFNSLGVNPVIALLFTLIFAVHPLLNQAVAWIPGRNDSLLTIFTLASMRRFLKYLDSKQPKHLLLHLLFFTLALFSKESAVSLVILTLFYLFFVKGEKLSNLVNYKELIGAYALVIVTWFFMRANALQGSTSDITLSSMVMNMITNMPLLFQYIGKAVIPVGFSVMSSIEDTNYIVGIVAIALIVTGIFLSKEKQWSMVIFGIAWFFLFLVPSLSASLFGGLEHRAYLPIVGFLITFSEFDWLKRATLKQTNLLLVVVSVIVLYAAVSFRRLSIFHDRFAFYKSAIETSPHSVLACLNLGKHYEEVQKYNEAIEAYRKGLERDSNYVMLHNNIGGAYMYMKDYVPAEVEIKKELAKHPKNSNAIYNLGLIYKIWGREEDAVALWRKTLEIEPNFIYAYQQLANYYRQKGRLDSAGYYTMQLKQRGY